MISILDLSKKSLSYSWGYSRPYGYYGLTLPGQPEQKIVAAWEEKIVTV